MKNNNYIDIKKYKNRWNFNIGIVVFGTIFIYLVITILMYLTASHVNIYEVREGTILNDYTYNGLIIREEVIVNSDADGYISYYIPETNKVAVGNNVYSISPQKMELEPNQDTDTSSESLTPADKSSLILKIQKYNESFSDNSFSDTYRLKSDIETTLQSSVNEMKMNHLNELIVNGQTEDLNIHQSSKDGIIVYNSDDFESITSDQIKSSFFDKSNYSKTDLSKNEEIKIGDPAYKLITSELWSIIIPLSKETVEQLANTTFVKTKILKDNEIIWADFKLIQEEDQVYGCLTFDNSMIRYATERYVDLEVIMTDKTGLKIPKTAKISKLFYVIPDSYLTTGGNSKATGVYRQKKDRNGTLITEFVETDIYNISEEKLCYIDTSVLKKGDTLIKPESTETFSVGETKELQGVYNINKGYAVFKQINIISESDDYYIVEDGKSYGLSNYDHIVLDGKTVKENDVVFQ